MLFVFSSSSRQGRRESAPAPAARRQRRPLAALACTTGVSLLAALACGSEASGGEASEADAPECVSDADCASAQACVSSVCVQRISITSRDAGPWACSVLSCPDGAANCCSAAAASATGNIRQAYSSRLQLLESASSRSGEVRAEFTFEAPDQQGWLTFQLDGEHDLSQLEFTGRHDGVADRFLSVNTNRLGEDGGCAFGFDLQAQPQPPGSDPSFLFGSEVFFGPAGFCYGNGIPGRASELAFAIFSTGPGDASLTISNITLHAR
jgi:hypothetical protein